MQTDSTKKIRLSNFNRRADSDLDLGIGEGFILRDLKKLLLYVIRRIIHLSSGGGQIIRIFKQLNTCTCLMLIVHFVTNARSRHVRTQKQTKP